MKIVVPFVQLNPAVRAALDRDTSRARDEVHYVDTSADVEAYWRVLCAFWAEEETFVVLEQDKVPVYGALPRIWHCPNLWCAYPVPRWQDGEYTDFPSLSCAKFDYSLMEQYPLLMEEKVGKIGIGGGDVPPRHYQRLDMAIALWVGAVVRGGVCWHPAGMVKHEHQEIA